MPTKRESILANIKSELENITEIKDVMVNKADPITLEILSFPGCLVYSGDEEIAGDQSIGEDEWLWDVFVEILTKGEDVEVLHGLVYAKLMVDQRRGGFAVWTKKLGSTLMFEGDFNHILITFEVRYSHDIGTP